MEMRERHIGPITTREGPDGSTVKVDAGALVRRLLLFEHCQPAWLAQVRASTHAPI